MISKLPKHGDVRVIDAFSVFPRELQSFRTGWFSHAKVAQVHLVYSDGFRVWSDSCFVGGAGQFLGDPLEYEFRRGGWNPPPLHPRPNVFPASQKLSAKGL